MDILSENWNRFLDTVMDWAPQLEYQSAVSQNTREVAVAGIYRENTGMKKDLVFIANKDT